MQPTETTADLLLIDNYLIRATTGKRFLNYIIDVIVYYIFAIGIAFLVFTLFPSLADTYAETESTSGMGLIDRLISLVFYGLYMSIMEAVFRGKSLGKLITGTRAVYLDGSPISASTAFARGFARAVPFCVFSAFGTPCNPWQDKWTDTMVIDEKESQLL